MWLNSQPVITEILDAIFLGLISSTIFYLGTTVLPQYRQKEIAKEYAIGRYIMTKVDMSRKLFNCCDKNFLNDVNFENNVLNYNVMREALSKDDFYFIQNNLDRSLIQEILYDLNQLDVVLTHLLTYDFVKCNNNLYRRIMSAQYWIKQFYGCYEIWYAEDDRHDFSKSFVRFIDSFLLGIDSGQKCDDFITLLRQA